MSTTSRQLPVGRPYMHLLASPKAIAAAIKNEGGVVEITIPCNIAPIKINADIQYSHTGKCFTAVDADTYDGAPDGNGLMGFGHTFEEVCLDLAEKMRSEG